VTYPNTSQTVTPRIRRAACGHSPTLRANVSGCILENAPHATLARPIGIPWRGIQARYTGMLQEHDPLESIPGPRHPTPLSARRDPSPKSRFRTLIAIPPGRRQRPYSRIQRKR
jgi:hypothetical protein